MKNIGYGLHQQLRIGHGLALLSRRVLVPLLPGPRPELARKTRCGKHGLQRAVGEAVDAWVYKACPVSPDSLDRGGEGQSHGQRARRAFGFCQAAVAPARESGRWTGWRWGHSRIDDLFVRHPMPEGALMTLNGRVKGRLHHGFLDRADGDHAAQEVLLCANRNHLRESFFPPFHLIGVLNRTGDICLTALQERSSHGCRRRRCGGYLQARDADNARPSVKAAFEKLGFHLIGGQAGEIIMYEGVVQSRDGFLLWRVHLARDAQRVLIVKDHHVELVPLLKENLLCRRSQYHAIGDFVGRYVAPDQDLGLDTYRGLGHDVALVEQLASPDIYKENRDLLGPHLHVAN